MAAMTTKATATIATAAAGTDNQKVVEMYF